MSISLTWQLILVHRSSEVGVGNPDRAPHLPSVEGLPSPSDRHLGEAASQAIVFAGHLITPTDEERLVFGLMAWWF